MAFHDQMPTSTLHIHNTPDFGAWGLIALLCCSLALPSTLSTSSMDKRNTQITSVGLTMPSTRKDIFTHDFRRFWSQKRHSKVASKGSLLSGRDGTDREGLSSFIDFNTEGRFLSQLLLNDDHIDIFNHEIRTIEQNRFSKHRHKQNSLSQQIILDYPKNSSVPLQLISKRSKRIVSPYHKKLFVYGTDDRLRISPPLLRKFPYSNIVRLSTGCTGTLVTPFHVLTAAHCVHTGRDFRNNLEMLKVEVPDSMGVRAYYIEKIGIPANWLHPRSPHEHQASWDYAVVKLSYGVHGRSHFFPLAVPTAGVLNRNLQFLGFPNNEDNLWMSVCPAKSNKAMVDGNLILTRCDSAVGNSGAAVLSDDFREGKKIIGVLSSTMPVRRIPFLTRFSIITALTWAKLNDICAEIGPIGVAYRVCPQPSTIPRLRRINIHNNVIPFFG